MKLIRFLIPIATLAVISVNYLAARGFIGGITPEYVSNKYPTQITPAGYAFSIWGLIYLGIIGFSIYQLVRFKSENLLKINTPFILTCVANIAWIFFWHHEMLFLSLFAMLLLLGSLAFINIKLKDIDKTWEVIFAKLPFSIYFGWVTVATILNITILFLSYGFQLSELASTIFGCILMLIATVLGILIRQKLEVIAYPLSISWALTAIAVKQSGNTAIVVACALGVIALLISAISFVLKDNKKLQ